MYVAELEDRLERQLPRIAETRGARRPEAGGGSREGGEVRGKRVWTAGESERAKKDKPESRTGGLGGLDRKQRER